MKRLWQWLTCRGGGGDDDTVQLTRHRHATETSSVAESEPLERGGRGDDNGGGGGGGGGGGAACECHERLRALELDNEYHKSTTRNLLNAVTELESSVKDLIYWASGNVEYSPNYEPDDRQQRPTTVEIHEAPPQREPEVANIGQITEADQGDCYNMNHKRRGFCHIFIHKEFDSKFLGTRDCADKEKEIVSETFEKIRFEVNVHWDFTREQIRKKLSELRRRNYKNHDCICFFVMSHGDANGTIWAKDDTYSIDIFERFFCNVKSLQNKPKLIFTQACRGQKVDAGVNAKGCTWSSDETDRSVNLESTPSKADFLLAHSTADGYVSFRQWFIPTLCEMINKYSEVCDLDEILRRTTDIVSTYESQSPDKETNAAKQVPTVTKTLRKKIFFNKK